MPENLTKAQDEALKKAWDLLTEHFDAIVLTTLVRAEGSEDNEIRHHYRYGGYALGIGLLETHKAFLLARYGLKEEGDDEEPG